MHINNFVNTFLQLNSINNCNRTILQKLLPVINYANVFIMSFL